MDFLQSVAKYYTDNASTDWSRMCFVFPSHRASTFFRQALRRELGDRVLFGVKMVTISDLVQEWSGMTVADSLTLSFELYKVYRQLNPDSDVDFDLFLSWASAFVGDFGDIDQYCINASQLYSNVVDFASLADDYSHLSDSQREAVEQFWNVVFDKNEDGDYVLHTRFSDNYASMFDLYTAFRKHLEERGIAYGGMIYRKVADDFAARGPIYSAIDDKHYAFVGFNALTDAEKRILKALKDRGSASFFWDYNERIIKRIEKGDDHGPGRFIRAHIDPENFYALPAPKDYRCPSADSVPQVTVTGFAYPQGQAFGVADFLSKHCTADNQHAERTAVVLTDENMLLPVLSALPPNVAKVNVTMGYKLQYSQVFGLVDLLNRLQRSAVADSADVTFYGRDVLTVLQHSCVTAMCADECNKAISDIVKNNRLRVPGSMFAGNCLLSQIFRQVHADGVPEYLRAIFKTIYDNMFPADADNDEADVADTVLQECIYGVLKVVNRFGDLLTQASDIIGSVNVSTIFSMFASLAKEQSVDFRGEPLDGLQVMGILETRAVDFDNLMILDMNEGVFPTNTDGISFIPYVIRKAFGMPTHEFKDSMYAYYFFRLISRVKNLCLLYSNGQDGKRSEMSRYILQLMYEYNWEVKRNVAVHKLNPTMEPDIYISKTPAIMQIMRDKYCTSIDRKLSPSAITQYMKCPVKFYLGNVAGIKENDDNDLLEDIDNRTFGNVFHHTMEQMYNAELKPGGVFSDDVRKRLLESGRIERYVLDAFRQELSLPEGSTIADLRGRNVIFYEIICKYVRQLVAKETQGFTYVCAEEDVAVPFQLNDDLTVYLGGIIDRQHIVGDKMYIVDYKTGKYNDDKMKVDVEKLFDPSKFTGCKEVLQAATYCMIKRLGGYAAPLTPAIIWSQNLHKNDSPYAEGIAMEGKQKESFVYDDAMHERFTDQFAAMLAEMFDDSEGAVFKPHKLDDCPKCSLYGVCCALAANREC